MSLVTDHREKSREIIDVAIFLVTGHMTQLFDYD
jgi:hypothetical protein